MIFFKYPETNPKDLAISIVRPMNGNNKKSKGFKFFLNNSLFFFKGITTVLKIR